MDIETSNSDVLLDNNNIDTNIEVPVNNIDVDLNEQNINLSSQTVDLKFDLPKIELNQDHSKLHNLDYEHSGHTGFQPAGDYATNDRVDEVEAQIPELPENIVIDADYVHTENNYTTIEKNKLAGLSNYDDTEIRNSLSNKVDKETGKGLSTNDFNNEYKNKLDSLENKEEIQISNAMPTDENIKLWYQIGIDIDFFAVEIFNGELIISSPDDADVNFNIINNDLIVNNNEEGLDFNIVDDNLEVEYVD